MILSKTNYMRGCNCQKYLWLHKHSKNSSTDEAKYGDIGIKEVRTDIGEVARAIFPNGTLIEFDSQNLDKMRKKNRRVDK